MLCRNILTTNFLNMITNLEALSALSEVGTMTQAATRLRITQSAVSKRIAALESEVGHKLVEPIGRRVRLTPAGVRLLEKTRPFLIALKEALVDDAPSQGGRIVIGVAESILCSWGAELLARVRTDIPSLEFIVNTHRSPVVIDQVRSGEYMLALCTSEPDDAPELKSELLIEEPMVIIPAGLKPLILNENNRLPVLTIEPHSVTWRCLERRLRTHASTWPFSIEVIQTLQSFACIAQMAQCGLANGLVPIGVARAIGVPEETLTRFPFPGLSRPISLIGRNTTFASPLVKIFHKTLMAYFAEQADNYI
jgi:DNA-binding transcriptional LysR family regulator